MSWAVLKAQRLLGSSKSEEQILRELVTDGHVRTREEALNAVMSARERLQTALDALASGQVSDELLPRI
jgi:hypothetical protein